MRSSIAVVILLTLTLIACGGSSGDSNTSSSSETNQGEVTGAQEPSSESPRSAGLDTELTLSPEIANAWKGIRVRVVRVDDQESETFDIEIGGSAVLGDSGLILSALSFVPDFVMDEDGITSRSESTDNPAARVQISDGGTFEYEGWLFASMPGIHAHPHPMYQVLLIEGIPAG